MQTTANSATPCCVYRPLLVLLLLLTLQFCLFAITVLLSYAIESAVAHLHHTLFGLTPPLPLETYLMLYCVSTIAECITEVQHRNWTILSVNNHFIMLTVVPNIVYILIFSLAFINIFIEFQAFHTLSNWHFGPPEKSGQTAFYMVSISYIVFCLTRVIHKDIFGLFRHLPHHQQARSVVLLFAFVSQSLATIVYALPILGITYLMIEFEWHIAVEFTILTSLAVLIGIGAAHLEMKKPCPKKRRNSPYYWYENVIYARIVLLDVVLVPSAHYLFFEPGKLDIFKERYTHSTYFGCCVSICVSHAVKILTTALMQHKNEALIFGWDWGKPGVRSKSHISQSGLDGGFLKDGDRDDSSSGQNALDVGGTANNNNDCDTTTEGAYTFDAVDTSSACVRGLPTFCILKELVQTPIVAVISVGMNIIRWVHPMDDLLADENESNIADNRSDLNFYREDITASSSVSCNLRMQRSIVDFNRNQNANIKTVGIFTKDEDNNNFGAKSSIDSYISSETNWCSSLL